MYEDSSSSASLSVLVILKTITILVGVKRYLMMGLLCTSLVTNDVDHIFSHACWLFVYLLWRNAVGHFFPLSFKSWVYILDIGPLSDNFQEFSPIL